MFHVSDGVFVDGVGGDVTLIITDDGREPTDENILVTRVFTKEAWASIIASVSSEGEDNGRFYKALEFHTGVKSE